MELNQVNCENTSTPVTSLSVSKLTNNDLELKLKNLVQQERKLLHLILLHIKEVENRKLYLKKAYPSLFEYLVKEYGYSAGGAMRRIEAARLLRDVPQMAQKIQTGLINLSQITEISRAVKEKQKESKMFISKQEKEDLVLKVAGLNLAETQKVVSFELNIKPKEFEKKKTQKNESVRLELTLTKEQMQKLNQCKDLAGHILEQKRMGTSLAAVIEVLMNQFLAKRGPGGGGHKPGDGRSKSIGADCSEGNSGDQCEVFGADHESKFISNSKIKNLKDNPEIKTNEAVRVSKLEANQIKIDAALKIIKNSAINSNSTANSNLNSTKTSQPNKTLTAKTKIKIHNRDKCCQYMDPLTKKICESTYKLEVDHKKPRWAEGNHQESNLQVLCKNHNSYKYKIEAGLIYSLSKKL